MLSKTLIASLFQISWKGGRFKKNYRGKENLLLNIIFSFTIKFMNGDNSKGASSERNDIPLLRKKNVGHLVSPLIQIACSRNKWMCKSVKNVKLKKWKLCRFCSCF